MPLAHYAESFGANPGTSWRVSGPEFDWSAALGVFHIEDDTCDLRSHIQHSETEFGAHLQHHNRRFR